MINIIALLAFPVLTAAPAPRATPSEPVDSADMTYVVVQNDRNVSVTVYEEDDFGDTKIAVLAPYESQTIDLHEFVFARSSIQFFVKPRGQQEEGSGLLDVSPGDHLGLVVPAKGK
jgi:hypothetical protein